MTSLVLSVALVLTPAPISAPKEPPSWTPTPLAAPFVAPNTQWSTSEWQPVFTEVFAPSSTAPVVGEPPPPPVEPPPPPPMTPIEAGMNRLAELGASPYQLRVFGCLAWFESKNDPYAVSRTNDHGLWQINRYYHAWRWRGRDIYDPTVNAEVAWDIYRESGWRAWSTHWSCGV